MTRKYLLSIIIPTKNRQYYCLHSVKQILASYGEEVEIVVQDNSDVPSLENDIKQLSFNNIVYNYKAGTLSFVDNFDLAIQHASGEYLMIIGDDDGVTSLALKVTKWANTNNIDAIRPSLSFVFFWPGSKVFESDDNGILNIYSFDGKMTGYNPQDGLRQLLRNGCQNYLDCEIIKLYHGIVRKDLLESIKEKTGKYVDGLSPDIYLSVALSLVSNKKAVSINLPVTISGICTGSGSSQSATGEHTGKLEDAPHFKGHSEYEWDFRIPRFYSVETIWGDSALAAVKDINPEFIKYYRPETLIYRCLRKYPQFREIIISNYKINGGTFIILGRYVCSRVKNKLMRKMQKEQENIPVFSIKNIKTIEDASKECESWIEKSKILESVAIEE